MTNKDKKEINNHDELVFAEEDQVELHSSQHVPWKLMIVDDEYTVHEVTKLALRDFEFEGKKLEFLSAYSTQEAKSLMAENPDIALMLLDVVMEKDDSGLQLVKYTREELNNTNIRIILRTGQPGQAPEKEVITNYDINDYKQKTELTTTKLFTTIISSLRSYRDLRIIDTNRKGLEKIIAASGSLFKPQSLQCFSEGVLTQLVSLLDLNESAIYCGTSGFAASPENGHLHIRAGSGEYRDCVNQHVDKVVPENVHTMIKTAYQNKQSSYQGNSYVGYVQSEHGSQNLLYLDGTHPLNEWEKNLIQVFGINVSAALDNIYLNQEIDETQKEVIFTLGEIIETRCQETSFHVKRVADISYLLALKTGMSESKAEQLRMASPMHDAGKVGIPDSILNKPDKHTEEESAIMKTHTTLGHRMLKNSKRNLLQTAAIIALQHHECYNGNGYPMGLKGDQIHIFSRITTIADVFDALYTDRIYRKAWPLERVLDYLNKENGKIFDPLLIKIFLDNIENFLDIWNKYTMGRDKVEISPTEV